MEYIVRIADDRGTQLSKNAIMVALLEAGLAEHSERFRDATRDEPAD